MGAPCPLTVSTDGSAANLRWYDTCSGYIWLFTNLAEGDAVGVRFGGPAQPAVNDANSVKRTITYFRNVAPGYVWTVDVYVDVDNDGDGCPDAPYLSDLNLDPGLRWNCSEFNAPVPSGVTSLIVRTQLDAEEGPTLATDGPFNNACEPFGAARSFYYPASSSLCLPWDGPTERADNFLYWLVLDGNPSPPVPVACCLADEQCQVMLPQDCIAAGGQPRYDMKDCANVDCTSQRPCCFPDESCEVLFPSDCEAAGGLVQAEGSSCATVLCPPPPGACCLPNGQCDDRTFDECEAAGGLPFGDGTSCATTSCPATQACCFGNGVCSDVIPQACLAQGGSPQGPGTACATTVCAGPQACCFSNGLCADVTESECENSGGVSQGPGTSCATSSCPEIQPAACCLTDGSCMMLFYDDCISQGGSPGDPGTTCEGIECAEACCFADGSCLNLPPSTCAESGGVTQGAGTSCGSSGGFCPSPPATGACCFGADCVVLTSQECVASGGVYLGDGVPCSASACVGTAAEPTSWGRIKGLYR